MKGFDKYEEFRVGQSNFMQTGVSCLTVILKSLDFLAQDICAFMSPHINGNR